MEPHELTRLRLELRAPRGEITLSYSSPLSRCRPDSGAMLGCSVAGVLIVNVPSYPKPNVITFRHSIKPKTASMSAVAISP